MAIDYKGEVAAKTASWPETVPGVAIVAKALREEGCDTAFGVYGWDFVPLVHYLEELGIKIYHMRHEQAGPWAAQGYAIGTHKPGVAFCSRVGSYNMVPGLGQAHKSRVPVVALVETAPHGQDHLAPPQETKAEDIYAPGTISKWAHTVTDGAYLAQWVRRAYRESQNPMPGVCAIGVPGDICIRPIHKSLSQMYDFTYMGEKHPPAPAPPLADPAALEQAMELLLSAERPLLIVGGDVYWPQVERELKELIELLSLPLHARRIARGVVPEDHPLVATGAARPALITNADVIMIIGLESSYLEGWLLPPVWSPFPKYIVSHETSDYHYFGGSPANVQVALVGNSGQVIRQMLAYAKAKVKPGQPPRWAKWLKFMDDTRKASFSKTRERVEKRRHSIPCAACAEPCSARETYLKQGAIDSEFAAQQVCDALMALDPSGTLILDSYHMSELITDKMVAKLPAGVVDAGIMQGLGHSIGVGIGLQVGRPGRQSLGMMGDAGFGISCMELETMVRYKLPHCVAIVNNGSWAGRSVPKFSYPYKIYETWSMMPGIRYDLMFAHLDGLHTEFCTRGDELRPALDRALQSGKPSLVHWFGDCEATSLLVTVLGLEWSWAMSAKRADLSETARRELHDAGPGVLLTTYFYMLSRSEFPKLEELCELCDIPLSQVQELGKKVGVM